MKTQLKFSLKVFLILTLPFLVVTGISNQLMGLSFLRSLTGSLMFGCIMTSALVSIHFYRLRKMGVQNFTDKNIGVRHKRRVVSEVSLEKIIEAVRIHPYFQGKEVTGMDNGFKVSSGASWMSWGESITAIVKPEENRFVYHIESRPILGLTVVDYGKNLKNITELSHAIRNATL